MKTTSQALLLALATAASLTSKSQVPDVINYQAVARDVSGNIMANQDIEVMFRIFNVPVAGTELFAEEHATVSTNQFGLFSLQIGTGSIITGSLGAIDWSTVSPWLEVAVEGTIVGARSQLVAVPYALLARDVENDAVDDADADPTNELQTISKTGSLVTLSDGGGSFTDDNTTYTGGTGISISGANVINNSGDADASDDITNVTTAGGDLSGTYPNPTVDGLQARPVLATIPGTNDVLKWNGAAWAPAADNTGLSLPYAQTINSASDAFSITNQGSGDALFGENSSSAANANAIYGKLTSATPAPLAKAVYGHVTATGNNGVGVYGEHGGNGYGVYGFAPTGYAVFGYTIGASGRAIYGWSTGANATAVTGVTNNPTATSIYGDAQGGGNAGYFSSNGGNAIVTGSGKVGIGISTPQNKLHVHDGSNSYAQFTNPTSGSASGDGLLVGYNLTGIAFLWNYENTNLNIGTNATSRIMILANGNVGIGSQSPDRHLDIEGSNEQYARITSTSGTQETGLELIAVGGGTDWRIQSGSGLLTISNGTDDLATTPTERYQIGTTDFRPSVDNSVALGGPANRWSVVYAVNGTIQTSDQRDKENIHDLKYGLDEILKLHPVSYTWKDQPEWGTRIGLLAQEVQPVVKEVVHTGAGGSTPDQDRMGINYSDLIPVLVKAIQEQQQLIEELQREIERLKN